MDHHWIVKPQQLDDMVAAMRQASLIGFDTEFVSEDTYYPHLCLIQAKVDDALYIIDPLELPDVGPFWEALAGHAETSSDAPGHITIAHAGREELRFCHRATNGKRPRRLFDAQIAAGLVGMEFPAAYSTLISKVIGKRLAKGETRTDWRKRPLSNRQIDYALQDVVHLDELYRRLSQKLDDLDRTHWLDEEMETWQSAVEESDRQERWRRVSGIAGLSAKQLAIVREVWRWRDAKAQTQDRPPKRVLRDDLVVELARRESADPQRIRAVRGFERRNYQRFIPEIADSIATALELDEADYPSRGTGVRRPSLSLLGQFLSTALGSLCRDNALAPGLVGGAQDLRDLVSYQLKLVDTPEVPKLAKGWRAEVVGKSIDRLLQGEILVSVSNPLSDQPLTLHDRPQP